MSVMKKVLLSILCVFLFSCSNEKLNDNSTPNDEPEQSYIELINNIDSYNSEYGVLCDLETKGKFWNFLKKLFFCDASGAAIGAAIGTAAGLTALGGLVGGLVSSMCCAVFVFDDTQTLQSVDESYVATCLNVNANLFTDVDTIDYYDSIGVWHNHIISEIYLDNPDDFLSYDEDEIHDLVLNKVEKYFPKADVIFYSAEQKRYYDKLFEYIENEDEVGLLEYLKKSFPNKSNDLKIIFMYLNAISTIETSDMISYHLGFKDIIMRSRLSQDSKNYISMIISVAGNSNLLWNVDYE